MELLLKYINKSNVYRVIIVLLSFLLLISGIALFQLKQTTPYKYLQNHFNESESAVYPVQLLYQANDESKNNIILVFYATKDGGCCCAVLEKNLFSFKLLDSSGALFFRDDKTEYKYGYYSGNYICSWHDYGDKRRSLFWGINKDESVEKLLVDGKESECVKMDYFQIFWSFGDWEDMPDFREIQAQSAE